MVKLLAALIAAYRVEILELFGAALIVAGFGVAFGLPAVLIAAGVFLLLKAFELDLSADPGDAS